MISLFIQEWGTFYRARAILIIMMVKTTIKNLLIQRFPTTWEKWAPRYEPQRQPSNMDVPREKSMDPLRPKTVAADVVRHMEATFTLAAVCRKVWPNHMMST